MLELRVAAAPAGEDDVKTLDDIIDGLRVEIKQAGLSTEGNGPADDIDTFDLFVLDKEGARCKVLVRWACRWGDKTVSVCCGPNQYSSSSIIRKFGLDRQAEFS